MGRRPRAGATAEDRITVRLTATERAQWAAAAGESSLGDWVRQACNAALSREGKATVGAAAITAAERSATAAKLRQAMRLLGEALETTDPRRAA